MTEKEPDRNPIEVIAEQFLEACREGKNPSVEEYAERHKEIADEIRDLLPTIAALEGLKVAHDDSGRNKVLIGPGMQERLGDYLILEEIGRGGMGIVYLAEQQSLGRQVALKVLPRQSLSDDVHLQRFKLEAQTAARLHHTNIVPIFGVGEQNGFHYFVMQYIRGLGLDEIVKELAAPGSPRGGSTSEGSASDASPSEAVAALRNGQFEPAPSTTGSSGSHPSKPPSSSQVISKSVAPAATAQIPSKVKGGQIYWHSVARIGAQVADALEYAHAQGTLHRDIKPANLILDAHGVVWVTDFGLAKAVEGPSLTRSTDLVGTLQYMPPEQLGGSYDARSDIYCLGLTLYELLTFKPAFPETDQRKLLAKGDPIRPSKIRDDIPRDLETIVQKAIAHDPRHRYNSARDLLEDLQAFLTDRPIRARRATAPEQLLRWCRRNKAIAVFATITLITLITAGITGWVSASRAHTAEEKATRQALAERHARDRAEVAEADAKQQADAAEQARDRAKQSLNLALTLLDNVFDSITGPDIIRPVAESFDTEGLDEEELTALEAVAAEPRFRPVVSERDAKLLERLLTFYDAFAAANSIDGEAQRSIADAQRRVGDLQQRLGRYDDAITAYDRALAVYNALSREPGSSETYLIETAILHNEIGHSSLATGSRAKHRRAEKEHLAVLVLTATAPRVQYEQVRAHLALGNLLKKKRPKDKDDRRPSDRNGPDSSRPNPNRPDRNRPDNNRPGRNRPDNNRPGRSRPGRNRPDNNRPDRNRPGFDRGGRRDRGPGNGPRRNQRPGPDAEEHIHFEAAHKLSKALLTVDSTNPSYRLLGARSARDLAHAIDPSNQDESAQNLYKQAIASLELLVHDYPDMPYYRYELASTYGMIRPHRESGGKIEERIRLENARALLATLVSEDQTVLEYRVALARTQKDIARLEENSAKNTEVEAHLRSVLKHETILTQSRPSSLQFQFDRVGTEFELARCLSRQDKTAEARTILEKSMRRMSSLSKRVELRGGPKFPINRHMHLLTRIYERSGDREAIRRLKESRREMREGRKR